jgi:SPP1 family predicted phage head-tail adaptor
MGAGGLRHRIEVQRDQGSAAAAGGEHLADWQTIATRWAQVRDASASRHGAVADAPLATRTVEVKLRYESALAITARDRFVLADGRVLEIQGIIDLDGRRRWWRATCIENAVPNESGS